MIKGDAIMRMMKARSQFSEAHPKVVAFMNSVFSTGIPAGTVIEISVRKPGEEPVTTNMRVTEEDLELMRDLQNLSE